MKKFIVACLVMHAIIQFSFAGEVDEKYYFYQGSSPEKIYLPGNKEYLARKEVCTEKSIFALENDYSIFVQEDKDKNDFYRMNFTFKNSQLGIKHFCVSPDSSQLLFIVSASSADSEFNQSEFSVYSLKDKKITHFKFDVFGLNDRYIKVDSLKKCNEKVTEGYSRLSTHLDFRNNSTVYGMINLFTHFAINNKGTKVVLSNNNALYLLDLLKYESNFIEYLPVKPIDYQWPQVVKGIGLNVESNELKVIGFD